jgi:anti-sigma factor RsiW
MNKPCENMKDKIADYVLGILGDDEIKNLEKHIEQCPGCRERLESLQKEREVLLQLCNNLENGMKAREET